MHSYRWDSQLGQRYQNDRRNEKSGPGQEGRSYAHPHQHVTFRSSSHISYKATLELENTNVSGLQQLRILVCQPHAVIIANINT